MTGAHLRPLYNRVDVFGNTVVAAADFLRGMWLDELREVRFDVAGMPTDPPARGHVNRWSVFRDEKRIVLYRVPIQRLGHLHVDDALHRRMMIESCVFHAVAEYLGKDPWELMPGHFHHH